MTSKITLTDLANLQNETTAVNAINNNNADITTAFNNTLSRDGTSPNQMSASLDMNSNRILNLATPLLGTDAARLVDLANASNIPASALQHQVYAGPSGSSSGTPTFRPLVASDIPALPITTLPIGLSATINTLDYGAIADGGSHHLSTRYATLAAAQAVYPFATALTQEIDYCACKAASNAAFGADGAEHGTASSYLNKNLFIGPGKYQFGSNTWLIRKLDGGKITGAGRFATQVYSDVTAMAFDGCWYTHFADFCVGCTNSAGITAFDLDGNIPGHPYDTFGVQSCTFQNIFFDGGGSTYAFANQLHSAGAGQGSEICWINCFFFNATEACLFSQGFNACDNAIYGGDCQVYSKHGVVSNNSQMSVYGMSFQSTTAYQQYLNGGWDIYCGDSGVGDSMIVSGCRTESIRFFYNGGSNIAHVTACSGKNTVSAGLWQSTHAYVLNDLVYTPGSLTNSFFGKLFICTTAGTSGSSEPTWPVLGFASPGTVTDGTVTWTQVPLEFIHNANGYTDLKTCISTIGLIQAATAGDSLFQATTTASTYQIDGAIRVVNVDATSNNVTIKLPFETISPVGGVGTIVTVLKLDTTSHTVTVSSANWGVDSGASVTIPGGGIGWVTLLFGSNAVGNRTWHVISQGPSVSAVTSVAGRTGTVVLTNSDITYPYAAKTANYTVLTTDYFIDCTSGTFTVTLPTAASVSGKIYNIKNSGTGVITVNTTSSQTIDGGSTASLPVQYTSISVISDGSNWKVF